MTPAKGQLRVKCQGPGCGKTFHSSRSTAKFCTPACRSRARRRPGAPAEDALVAATRAELGDKAGTVAGLLALRLAQQIGNQASVALVRELRALITEAVGKVPEPEQVETPAEEEPDDEVAIARRKAAELRSRVG